MTPQEFIAKWKPVTLSERSACQQHFLALCELLDQPKPVDVDPTGEWYTFEKGVQKAEGGDGWADVWMRGHFGWEYKRKHRNLTEAYKQLLLYREALENPYLLIVCDMDRFEVHTNFPNTVNRVHTFDLDGLADPANLDVLRKAFCDPAALRPELTPAKITEEAAKQFAELADRLRMREEGTGPIGAQHPQGRSGQSDLSPFPDPAQRIAHFLMRLMFCMFGEDIGLLPSKLFARLLEQGKRNPATLTSRLEKLFAAMATGGDYGAEEIPWFNGGLFDDDSVIPLAAEEVNILAAVNDKDWSQVEPSIFGTLFECTLDPGKRSQIGAHYTSREDIETLVQPVVMAPLRQEWAEVRRRCEEDLWPAVVEASRAQGRRAAKPSAARNKFDRAIQDFVERLAHVSVLDPACGSGNFLYVSLHLLLDLEKEVITYAASHGLSLVPHVHPRQLSGLEINPYAQQLASVVLWIGYLQWMHFNGFKPASRPVLEPIKSIRCQDAILDLTEPEHPKEPEWPEAEFIVSNPPFLGDKKLRASLGHDYVDLLFRAYDARLPNQCDLCCYWFEKARRHIEVGKCKRAGLLATQGIRGGASRDALKRIKASGDIFFAESDKDWVLDGANVHISMIGFDAGQQNERSLDGRTVSSINSNLTAQTDVTTAVPLASNAALSFQGPVKVGPFEINDTTALDMLLSPNPTGHPNSSVIRPWLNGIAITRREPPMWIIDFGEKGEAIAAGFEAPFEYARKHVKPVRDVTRRDRRRRLWWIHGEVNNSLREALKEHLRYGATCQTAKHRVFVWVDAMVLPAQTVIAFARSDDAFLGMLESRLHRLWGLLLGTHLETRPRYTPTTTCETFPFPQPTPPQEAAIAAAAKELDELRVRWLNPPEWTKTEVLEFPGSADGPWARYVVEPNAGGIGTVRWPRIVHKDPDCAASLKKRTLTNLYNQRPAWLDLAHQKLDAAVFAAYGWEPTLSDEELLEKLLALNLERAGEAQT